MNKRQQGIKWNDPKKVLDVKCETFERHSFIMILYQI